MKKLLVLLMVATLVVTSAFATGSKRHSCCCPCPCH